MRGITQPDLLTQTPLSFSLSRTTGDGLRRRQRDYQGVGVFDHAPMLRRKALSFKGHLEMRSAEGAPSRRGLSSVTGPSAGGTLEDGAQEQSSSLHFWLLFTLSSQLRLLSFESERRVAPSHFLLVVADAHVTFSSKAPYEHFDVDADVDVNAATCSQSSQTSCATAPAANETNVTPVSLRLWDSSSHRTQTQWPSSQERGLLGSPS
ncbi:unnamed protein product [Pleuronectes platessa]|uniref:Uncharacterized protein n=1 Tax=Pleuronectes platessa TaxID=8262 RepID=A0A9N7VKT9_PLEPL|nr:unnamed protein product [Pleuronectes platessa]